MAIYKWTPFLVREEAHTRMLTRNIDCFNQIDIWDASHPGHTVQVVNYLEEGSFNRLLIRAEGANLSEVGAVNAIIERLYAPTVPSDWELWKTEK